MFQMNRRMSTKLADIITPNSTPTNTQPRIFSETVGRTALPLESKNFIPTKMRVEMLIYLYDIKVSNLNYANPI